MLFGFVKPSPHFTAKHWANNNIYRVSDISIIIIIVCTHSLIYVVAITHTLTHSRNCIIVCHVHRQTGRASVSLSLSLGHYTPLIAKRWTGEPLSPPPINIAQDQFFQCGQRVLPLVVYGAPPLSFRFIPTTGVSHCVRPQICCYLLVVEEVELGLCLLNLLQCEDDTVLLSNSHASVPILFHFVVLQDSDSYCPP